MKDRCDEWVQQLSNEKSAKIAAGILSLLAAWFGCGQRVSSAVQGQLIDLIKKTLTFEGHQVPPLGLTNLLVANILLFSRRSRLSCFSLKT